MTGKIHGKIHAVPELCKINTCRSLHYTLTTIGSHDFGVRSSKNKYALHMRCQHHAKISTCMYIFATTLDHIFYDHHWFPWFGDIRRYLLSDDGSSCKSCLVLESHRVFPDIVFFVLSWIFFIIENHRHWPDWKKTNKQLFSLVKRTQMVPSLVLVKSPRIRPNFWKSFREHIN